MAGIAGCDPEPLTLRRLAWRAEGVKEQQWSHTSALLSMLEACRQSNVAFDPNRWNPYGKKRTKAVKRSTPAEHRAFWQALKAGESARVATRR